jgi:hypothetical protein
MAFELSPKGTLRLRVVLAAAEIAALALALAVALVLNGPPYWRGWWFVMAALFVAAIPASLVISRLVEWVIAGYRAD